MAQSHRSQITVKLVVDPDRDAWNAFVAAAGGSFLQSWQWGEFKRRQGWHVLRLEALGSPRAPQAAMQVLVRAVPGLGAFCYGPEGPVVPPGAWSDHSTAVRALLAEARKQSAPYGALALRVDPLTGDRAAPLTLAALGLRRCAHGVQPAATAVVDLGPSQEELWHGLARDARYRIRRAQRDGVVLREGAAEDIVPLAAMLAETGQRKGFGVRGAAYLRALAAMLRSEDSGTLIVAELDGAVVGATLVATFGQRAASLYTASDARGRRVGAQHLLHWAAMLRAKEDRCALYDFRGVSASGAPTGNWEGLDFFKQRFGTRREELAGAWDHVYRPLAYQAFLLALEARQRGPRLLTPLWSRLHR